MQAIVAAFEGALKAAFTKSPWLILIVFALSGGGLGTAINALTPIRKDAHTATMDKQIMEEHREWEEGRFAPMWQTEQRLLEVEKDCEERDGEIERLDRQFHAMFDAFQKHLIRGEAGFSRIERLERDVSAISNRIDRMRTNNGNGR